MRIFTRLLIVAGIAGSILSVAQAQMLSFSKKPNAEQMECLRQLLSRSSWKDSPSLLSEMFSIAQVATAVLDDKWNTDYVYIFEGFNWCGTAGCKLLIGELRRRGVCHLLYEAAGDTVFTVLRRRDHGYRRLYTPCEARFDGHQYQQFHEDCPNVDVRR
ncbi:MAG: hypothetical protein WA728_36555 [Xanthobacteraceae bacterium]